MIPVGSALSSSNNCWKIALSERFPYAWHWLSSSWVSTMFMLILLMTRHRLKIPAATTQLGTRSWDPGCYWIRNLSLYYCTSLPALIKPSVTQLGEEDAMLRGGRWVPANRSRDLGGDDVGRSGGGAAPAALTLRCSLRMVLSRHRAGD